MLVEQLLVAVLRPKAVFDPFRLEMTLRVDHRISVGLEPSFAILLDGNRGTQLKFSEVNGVYLGWVFELVAIEHHVGSFVLVLVQVVEALSFSQVVLDGL